VLVNLPSKQLTKSWNYSFVNNNTSIWSLNLDYFGGDFISGMQNCVPIWEGCICLKMGSVRSFKIRYMDWRSWWSVEQLEMDETKKIIACSIVVQFSWVSIWWSVYHASSKYNTLWSTTNIDYYFWQVCKAKYSCSLSSSGTSISALGSFTMELFTLGSDLDLSVSLGHTGDAFPRKKIFKFSSSW